MTVFRNAAKKDVPQLKRLWARSFGDNEDSVQRFLDHFGFNIGVVAETSGAVSAAAYLIPTGGICFPGGSRLSCSYIYALAVLPEHRGSGLGKELTYAAVRFSMERGYDYAVLKPSRESLYEFYGKLGFERFSYANELRFDNILPGSSCSDRSLYPLSPSVYMEIREELLKNRAHVALSLKQAEYQAKLGKLFSLTSGDAKGCAAIETHNGRVNVKELLISESALNVAVSAIAGAFPSDNYIVSSPVFDKNQAVPTGMVYPSLRAEYESPFLGLAYD